jgi:hypothetical protein
LSYRRKAKQAYSATRKRQHLPSLNVAFRSTWDRGLDEALPRIEKLRSEGWNIDYERGALTQSQAEVFAAHVEKHGFETTRIPVAKWGEDLVQFVAYKPKQPEPGETVIPPPVPQLEPKKVRVEKEFDPVERFQKTFWRKGIKPDEPVGGTIMSPDRTIALVRYAADPDQQMTKLAADTVSKAATREPLDHGKLLKAEKAGKDKVKFGKESYYSIKRLKNAIKIVGTSEAFHATDVGVLAIRNQRGDVVLIAPIVETDPSGAIGIEELQKL